MAAFVVDWAICGTVRMVPVCVDACTNDVGSSQSVTAQLHNQAQRGLKDVQMLEEHCLIQVCASVIVLLDRRLLCILIPRILCPPIRTMTMMSKSKSILWLDLTQTQTVVGPDNQWCRVIVCLI